MANAAPVSNQVTLKVGGTAYAGWTELSVSRGIEQAAGGFEIAVTNRWAGQAKPVPIKAGDECALVVGADTLITGYVDEVEASLEESNHAIRITGRDRAADLIDCSAIHSPDQWTAIKLDRLAGILAQPFGVAVTAETDVGAPLPTVKLQQGETAWEAIERHARMRALLVISDGHGGLLLTRAGHGLKAKDALVEGDNLKAVSITASIAERFSDYAVKGQRSAASDDDDDAARRVSGKAKDEGVARYRPLLVLAEGESDGISAADRAAWEAAVRAGRATRVSATLGGWRQSDGALWPLNGLVRVKSPLLDIDTELLIAEIKLTLNATRGSTAELSLARADAYRVLPTVAKGKGTGVAGSLPDNTQLVIGGDFLSGGRP